MKLFVSVLLIAWTAFGIWLVLENKSLKANQCTMSSIRSDDLGLKRVPKPALTDYERYLLERK